MNARILLFTLITTSAFQVACGGKSKGEKIQAFWAECSKSQACMDMYANAGKNAGIIPPAALPPTTGAVAPLAGPAAVAGQPQVAPVGTTPVAGQVPNTSVLPVSISDAQIRQQGAQITAALQQINAAQPTATPAPVKSAAPVATPASVVGSYQTASIGVTRLEDAPMPSASSYESAPVYRNPSAIESAPVESGR